MHLGSAARRLETPLAVLPLQLGGWKPHLPSHNTPPTPPPAYPEPGPTYHFGQDGGDGIPDGFPQAGNIDHSPQTQQGILEGGRERQGVNGSARTPARWPRATSMHRAGTTGVATAEPRAARQRQGTGKTTDYSSCLPGSSWHENLCNSSTNMCYTRDHVPSLPQFSCIGKAHGHDLARTYTKFLGVDKHRGN